VSAAFERSGNSQIRGMEALRVEQCIFEGDKGIKELFKFVQSNAGSYEAYDMEKAILAKVLKIGLAAMRCYFAERGTGDVGTELELEDGTILRRESGLQGRDYFSVFGKVKIPRSCYRTEGHIGVMPLDAQANLPELLLLSSAGVDGPIEPTRHLWGSPSIFRKAIRAKGEYK
jgi:hypothetical protein